MIWLFSNKLLRILISILLISCKYYACIETQGDNDKTMTMEINKVVQKSFRRPRENLSEGKNDNQQPLNCIHVT